MRNPTSGTADDAVSALDRQPTRAASERRSPLRPRFSESWRKAPPSGGPESFTADYADQGSLVSVWVSSIATLLASSAHYRLLSDEDQASLSKIRLQDQRDSAVAARMLLRLSLSLATNRRVDPRSWRFERTALGKPFVKSGFTTLQFSVSHTDRVVIVAIADGAKLGVDLESVDQPFEDLVIDHVCDSAERRLLRSLPSGQRSRCFLQLWSQKEAYTKMLGAGHSLDFKSFRLFDEQGFCRFADVAIEQFYFSEQHTLYYGALAIEQKRHGQPFDVRLIKAEIPGAPPCVVAPYLQLEAGSAPQ